MNVSGMKEKLKRLSEELEGELFYDTTIRTLYATDASAYRELPLAVAIPKTREDILKLISFAGVEGTSLIPRTAGTSLAGQVVGHGIVVDVSKHFNQVLEFNKEERWVKVQPGVIRDELNLFLKPHGLYLVLKHLQPTVPWLVVWWGIIPVAPILLCTKVPESICWK